MMRLWSTTTFKRIRNEITILDIVITICLGLYVLVSFIRKNWNDFFYAFCLGLLIISDIPLVPYIILLLTLIILHTHIQKKERDKIKNEADE